MARTPKKTKVRLSDPRGARRPLRRCALTREVGAKDELLRLVLDPTGIVSVDVRARAPGRGVYVSPRREVVAQVSTSKGLGRLFRGQAVGVGFRLDEDEGDERPSLPRILGERLTELVALARRAGELTVGAEAVSERVKAGVEAGAVLVLAGDLGRTTHQRAVAAALGVEGLRLRVAGAKGRFGEALGRGEAGVLLVSSGTLADRIAAEGKRLVFVEGGSAERVVDPAPPEDGAAEGAAPDEDQGPRRVGPGTGHQQRRVHRRRTDEGTSGPEAGPGARGRVTHG